jgi:hypothetical protein
MYEVDDRLEGDPVWELFPGASEPTPGYLGPGDYGQWLALACLLAACWLWFPALAVVLTSLAVAVPHYRRGRQRARSIPDKAGGEVCAWFNLAWGAFLVGAAAFVQMFVELVLAIVAEPLHEPPALLASLVLWIAGFKLSAALIAAGTLTAYRFGMRVWIGEGVNRARTLLLGMLIAVFTLVVLGPWGLWLVWKAPRANDIEAGVFPILLVEFGALFGGAVVIVLVVDWLSRRVVADPPGKFGPKVPTVGKWYD